MSHFESPISRRDFLARSGAGFGQVALASLLARDSLGASSSRAIRNPLSAKKGHFEARAKNIIWCFIDGGPSHLDLFDPKPNLQKLAGQPLPPSFKRPMTAMGSTANTPLLASKRTFKQHGQAGIWMSDWLPELASCADDLCVIQSCVADGQTHVGSVCQMNTGSILAGRPSLGAWVLYGLGSESEDLPGFVVMTDYSTDPPGGPINWGTGFMPATYQGTRLADGKSPFLDVEPAAPIAESRQQGKLDYIQRLNHRHHSERPDDDKLEARIASYELAYKMQSAAPEAVDLSGETAETLGLYGIDQKDSEHNGRNCLLARRFIERGVRCVQLYMGAGSKWDAHTDVEENHSQYCLESDRPIAGLLKDLKRRGLLDSTLVIWGGEFGRTPMSESGKGRDHNPFGFTMWMAGGGVKPGMVYGATDEVGLYAVENRAHLHDIHATILHLMGLDHEELTFLNNGRDERLTITEGVVIDKILA
jgi:uncharacterized protein DUF1501